MFIARSVLSKKALSSLAGPFTRNTGSLCVFYSGENEAAARHTARMRIVAVSDTHLLHDELVMPPGDIYRDRDTLGIREVPGAARCSWPNPYAESVIGSIQRELLDPCASTTAECRQPSRRKSGWLTKARRRGNWPGRWVGARPEKLKKWVL